MPRDVVLCRVRLECHARPRIREACSTGPFLVEGSVTVLRLLSSLACPRRALHFGWGQPLTHSWIPEARVLTVDEFLVWVERMYRTGDP
jgi:hypothetical protein